MGTDSNRLNHILLEQMSAFNRSLNFVFPHNMIYRAICRAVNYGQLYRTKKRRHITQSVLSVRDRICFNFNLYHNNFLCWWSSLGSFLALHHLTKYDSTGHSFHFSTQQCMQPTLTILALIVDLKLHLVNSCWYNVTIDDVFLYACIVGNCQKNIIFTCL